MAGVLVTHEVFSALKIFSSNADARRKALSRLYAKGFPRPFARGRWREAEVSAWLAGEPLAPAAGPLPSNDDVEHEAAGDRRRARLERMRSRQ